MDKCYWPFAREFIPAEERFELKRKWNCSSRRDLSLAWIKDSLNRGNLQFQMFGFIASDEELKKIYYERNACIRNKILLKKICLLFDEIDQIQFNIEVIYFSNFSVYLKFFSHLSYSELKTRQLHCQ
jgi:hypothetical protein